MEPHSNIINRTFSCTNSQSWDFAPKLEFSLYRNWMCVLKIFVCIYTLQELLFWFWEAVKVSEVNSWKLFKLWKWIEILENFLHECSRTFKNLQVSSNIFVLYKILHCSSDLQGLVLSKAWTNMYKRTFEAFHYKATLFLRICSSY